MRKIGSRTTRLPDSKPSVDGLRRAAIHERTGRALAAVSTTGIVKGIYRFASHEEMNRHTDEALARVIAMNVRARDPAA